MKKVIALLSLFVISIAGCTTDYNKLIGESEKTFYSGKYLDAAKKILPQVNTEDRNQLLFMMECGLMLHAANMPEKSNEILMGAAKLADRIATSISKTAAGLLLNETKTNYKGEDFERVLIHMYMGINFLMLQKYDDARVSFKKVNELLRDINVSTGKNYKQNIMAKYLTAIAFELSADLNKDENDREFAYIEYKQIQQLEPKLNLVYRDLQRLAKQLGDMEDFNKWKNATGKSFDIPKDAGELILIYQAGQGAVKVSRGPILDDVNMKTSINVSLNSIPKGVGVTVAAALISLRIAEHPIPDYKMRSNKIKNIVININGQDLERTSLLENIEETAIQNLKDDYTRIYTQVALGVATKAVAAVAADIAAKKAAEQFKQTSGFAGVIGAVAGLATGATLASQIKPDLRCWHTLPANFQIGRVFIKPGEYNVTYKFIDANGNQERFITDKVVIQKGKKTFYNYRTLY